MALAPGGSFFCQFKGSGGRGLGGQEGCASAPRPRLMLMGFQNTGSGLRRRISLMEGLSLSPPLGSWFLGAKEDMSSLGPEPCLTLEPAGQTFTYCVTKSMGQRVR